MSAIIEPKRPPMTVSPPKAMIVVSEAARTGMPIRVAAFSAASKGPSFNARCRQSACSPTTMASSTTIPSVMISANSEIMFRLMPATYITATADSMLTGMPIATHSAVRALRKRNSSTSTSASPCAPFLISRFSRAEISCARALASWISTPSGSDSSISSATSCTVFWMPMASPLAERLTRTTMAWLGPT